MPFQLTIPVAAAAPWEPTLDDQRGMHSVFFAALTHSDAALADRVHAAHVNPFTQALLGGRRQDDGMRWRVTLLDDALYEPFVGGLHEAPPERVQGKPIELQLQDMAIRHDTYDALIAGEPAERYPIQFDTPTAFKKQYYHSPIPEPALCWQSWWTRWQAFAPPRLAINVAAIDIVAAHVVISRFRLASRAVSNARWHIIGAVGRVTYSTIARDRVDAAWWRDITALARFSDYAGTGHKTAFGLGQTRLQPGAKSARDTRHRSDEDAP